MLRKSQHETIHELSKIGYSQRTIARMLGVDRKTVWRHLQKEQWKEYQRPVRGDVLIEPFHDWTLARAKEVNYNASVLFRELKLKGYTGSYETVKKCVFPLRSLQNKASVRFETPNNLRWIGEVLTHGLTIYRYMFTFLSWYWGIPEGFFLRLTLMNAFLA